MADNLRRETQREGIAVRVNSIHIVQLERQRIGVARCAGNEILDRVRVKIRRSDKEIFAHTHVTRSMIFPHLHARIFREQN